MSKNNSADSKVSAQGGEGGAAGVRDPPAAHGEDNVKAAVALQPLRSMEEQRSTCTPWRTPCQSRWMSKGGCDPTGHSGWSRLLARTCGPVENSPPWNRLAGRLVSSWGIPAGAACP